MNETERPISRRRFLRDSAAMSVGLWVGASFTWPFSRARAEDGGAASSYVEFNAWIHISKSGAIQFILDKAEMGQGVMTTLTTIVAEELAVDPASIEVLFAPPGPKYVNPKLFFTQITGGSTSVAGSWNPLRRAAAAARYALLKTAADQLGANIGNCQFVGNKIVDTTTGKSVSFSDIVASAGAAANELDPEDKAIQPRFRLKSEGGHPATDLKYLGKPMTRLDAHAKVTGAAEFGIDVTEVESRGVRRKVLVCVIVRCPVPGGKLKDYSPKELVGEEVRFVVPMKTGVGVIADTYWQALQASKQLKCEWELGQASKWSTPSIRQDYQNALKSSGILVSKDPWWKLEVVMEKEVDWSSSGLTAIYETPYVPHSTMEPMNCTAWVQDDHCEIWAPTQAPAAAREIARQITGLALEKISVHNTFLGGGFGRRIYQDFVAEAVQVSKWAKAPVKVIWTREDDFKHDYYRPATLHQIKGKLGSDGTISHWLHHTVGQSIFSYITNVFLDSMAVDLIPSAAIDFMGRTLGKFFEHHAGKLGIADPTSVEGIVTDATVPDSAQNLPYLKKIPYAIDNFCLEYTPKEPGIPVGFFRSVGHSHTAFVVECFMDELAHQAGKDPCQFRIDLLKKAGATRNIRVLQLLAEKSGWGSPLPSGVFRGIAQHESFGTLVAHVVELSIENGKPKIHRVVSAVDCGFVLNPDMVEAQIQGGIIFGLSAALKQEITIKNGEIEQQRFDQCDPIRMFEAPAKIEVYIVPSDSPPTGIGEPGVPPVAPAVCNAIFAATGKRIRSLPVRI